MEIPKKLPYISGNRNPKKLLIFWEMRLSSPSSKNNNKKNHPEKISYTLIFSQKNAVPIFHETETPKKFFILQERNFLKFQETETLKNFLYFRKELTKPQ